MARVGPVDSARWVHGPLRSVTMGEQPSVFPVCLLGYHRMGRLLVYAVGGCSLVPVPTRLARGGDRLPVGSRGRER